MTGGIKRGIFILRLNICEAHLNGGKLVAADAAAQDFIETGLGVELPLTCFVDEGNGKRPVVIANDEGPGSVSFHLDGVLGVIGRNKVLPNITIRHWIA